MTKKLRGVTILVPESRELDLFAGMLEAYGARTLRCPLVTILDAADSTPVEAWLQRLMCGEFDDLILLTGEGLRRLIALGERLGTRSEVVAAIQFDFPEHSCGLRAAYDGPQATEQKSGQ